MIFFLAGQGFRLFERFPSEDAFEGFNFCMLVFRGVHLKKFPGGVFWRGNIYDSRGVFLRGRFPKILFFRERDIVFREGVGGGA